MPLTDLLFIIKWWALLSITGLCFLPLSVHIFPRFLDKGYGFAKILGVVIVSYLVFLLGIFKLAPFSHSTIYAVFFLCFIPILFFYGKNYKQILKSKVIFLLIIEEIIFFLCLLGWSYVKGFNPEIYGLEKYMDFGFVNTILRSEYFPPIDMWYSGLPINYYYFGHFITAVLTKASNIPSFITYNLMIATLFALCFFESFSLGITLISRSVASISKNAFRIFFGGLVIACLVSLSGNLHILYTLFTPYQVDQPVPMWELKFSLYNPCYQKESYKKLDTKGNPETIFCSEQERQTALLYPNSYWYPNATRFIHNTIHEFPIYSWVVADLHGHVADIPIVLLTISVLFSLVLKSEVGTSKLDSKQNNQTHKSSNHSVLKFLYLPLIGFLLAVMYMTNAWDGLTYLLLTSLVLLYNQWSRVYKNTYTNTTNNPLLQILPIKNITKSLDPFLQKNSVIDLLIGIFVSLFIILSAFFLFSRPFSMNFNVSELVGGVGVVGAPSFLLEKNPVDLTKKTYGYDNRNLLKKLFVPDHCKSLMNETDAKKVTTTYSNRKIGPFLFESDHCLRSPWWQLLILYGFFYFFVFAFFIYLYKRKSLKSSDSFILLLIVLSSTLIIIPEFFYMKDIYPDHYRANTMFKLVFQAFIMLSIVSGYSIVKTISKINLKSLSIFIKPIYLFYVLLAAILLTLVLTYPYFAINSYYNNLKTYIGLDGTSYIKNKNVGDYEAIRWLNTHVINQPVIVEAQGDSYTDYERISANTGLPTILGWYVHEWLWRGQDAPNSRTEDIRNIYESHDILLTKKILQKYKVKYIILGSLEKEKYTQLYENKFKELGEKVFQSGNTTIYKTNF